MGSNEKYFRRLFREEFLKSFLLGIFEMFSGAIGALFRLGISNFGKKKTFKDSLIHNLVLRGTLRDWVSRFHRIEISHPTNNSATSKDVTYVEQSC